MLLEQSHVSKRGPDVGSRAQSSILSLTEGDRVTVDGGPEWAGFIYVIKSFEEQVRIMIDTHITLTQQINEAT